MGNQKILSKINRENWFRKHWAEFSGSCAARCALIQVLLYEKWHRQYSSPIAEYPLSADSDILIGGGEEAIW